LYKEAPIGEGTERGAVIESIYTDNSELLQKRIPYRARVVWMEPLEVRGVFVTYNVELAGERPMPLGHVSESSITFKNPFAGLNDQIRDYISGG
jgi:hypothetical protein